MNSGMYKIDFPISVHTLYRVFALPFALIRNSYGWRATQYISFDYIYKMNAATAPRPASNPPAAAKWLAPLLGWATGELLTAELDVGAEAGVVALATTTFVFVVFLPLCDWNVFGTVMVFVPVKSVELWCGAPVLAMVGWGTVDPVTCVALTLSVEMMTGRVAVETVELPVEIWIWLYELCEVTADEVVKGGRPVAVVVCS